jgi:hypothetical protein
MISTREFYLGSGQNFRIPAISAESITLEPNTTLSFQRCTIKTKNGDVSFPAQTITNNSTEIMQLSIIDGALQLTPLEAAPVELGGGAEDFTADAV